MNDDAAARCSQAAFESLYRTNSDPWNFATSAYERARYETILTSLTRSRYGVAFEPGCSVGELTHLLAQRCERVIATDIAPSAVTAAKRRCEHCDNVEVLCASIENGIPRQQFDLIAFCEIGYYFVPDVLRQIATEMARSLAAGAELVAVHWLGNSRDHVLHGDAVHEILRQELPLRWLRGNRHSGFVIDTWLME